ncbi:hypothetical protein D3C86_1371850 [compost metagenome]
MIPTGRYNFLAASCCNVEVVKGAAGVFFVGLVSKSDTLYIEPIFLLKKSSASFFVLKFFGSFALNVFPASLENSATTE